MYSAQLFVLCFCGSLILERYGVLGQVMVQAIECMDGETLSAVSIVCPTPPEPCMPPIVGRFAFGLGSGACMVTDTGIAGGPCFAVILTCITDPTTTTTTSATTTTAAAVDSPESVGSPESVDSSASDNSRRR